MLQHVKQYVTFWELLSNAVKPTMRWRKSDNCYSTPKHNYFVDIILINAGAIFNWLIRLKPSSNWMILTYSKSCLFCQQSPLVISYPSYLYHPEQIAEGWLLLMIIYKGIESLYEERIHYWGINPSTFYYINGWTKMIFL